MPERRERRPPDAMRKIALGVVALLLTQSWGCGSKSEPSSVTDAVVHLALEPGDPTILNIWPNLNGTSWSYRTVYREWVFEDWEFYPDSADVPPVPTMDELEELLGHHPIGEPVYDWREGTYGLKFDGRITTASGVTAQNLVESLNWDPPAAGSYENSLRPWNERFLARLAQARPELEMRFPGHVPVSGEGDWGPIFLHGYAWEKVRSWIGAYSDFDQMLAWKYLQPDLEPSSEFIFEVFPDWVAGVVLHCRVLRWFDFQMEDGTTVPALEALYLLEWGLSLATDPDGHEIGYFRIFDYGLVSYAATVGPVACYERGLVETGDPVGVGYYDWTLRIRRMTDAVELP